MKNLLNEYNRCQSRNCKSSAGRHKKKSALAGSFPEVYDGTYKKKTKKRKGHPSALQCFQESIRLLKERIRNRYNMGDISRVEIDPNANKEGTPIGDMYTIHTKSVNPNIPDYLDTKDVSSVK